MASDPKKKMKYSTSAMDDAVKAVRNGMATKTAAKRFGVPRSTFQDKVAGRYREGKRPGRDTFLSAEEEQLLVE